ncbi:MAG TPA: gamma carbonic anhydrase family protein [Planctomycetaceae bacterium]|nr:gamma carbonic anhydrase family protein [Planctomycetaceae bacterium]HRF01944.1 gamma carbonic anhydrase family protein [Pirellulaceae bacterium]
MPLDYRFDRTRVAASAWIASSADVMGDVRIGERSSVWFGAVARGDGESIAIGDDTNVQDGAILHADPGLPCRLGDRVTVGHGAIVHGAIVEADSLIGIRATVLNGATIGAGSLIAAGALVPERTVIPPGSLAMGVPAKVVRPVTEADRERIGRAWKHYVQAAREARESLGDGRYAG